MKKFAAAVSLAILAGAAGASSIAIQTGNGYQSGLASADAYRTAVSAIVGAPTDLASYDNLALNLNGQGLEGTITFYVTSATSFDFRAGVDFGGGGALFLDGNALDFKGNDMWWAGNYGTASQFLAGAANLGIGAHTLQLYGFEDCCSGNGQVQFSVNGGQSYTSFGTNDGLPAVPEAQNFAMLLAGLGLVGSLARRRSNKQA
jgi:hypothetical protein